MRQLTQRQRQVLEAVQDFQARKGFAPSIRELGKILGISSLRGVTIHLDALERKGWIKRESTSRSIRLLSAAGPGFEAVRIPLVTPPAAGSPLLAAENVHSYVSIPTNMAASARELFALRVNGNSSNGDGILAGDIVIVRSQQTAEPGDMVAALVGSELTVGPFDPTTHQALEIFGRKQTALNKEARLLGRVIGLIRSYSSTQSA